MDVHPTRAGSAVLIHAKSSVIPWEVHKPQKWQANTSLSSRHAQHGPCQTPVLPHGQTHVPSMASSLQHWGSDWTDLQL